MTSYSEKRAGQIVSDIVETVRELLNKNTIGSKYNTDRLLENVLLKTEKMRPAPLEFRWDAELHDARVSIFLRAEHPDVSLDGVDDFLIRAYGCLPDDYNISDIDREVVVGEDLRVTLRIKPKVPLDFINQRIRVPFPVPEV